MRFPYLFAALSPLLLLPTSAPAQGGRGPFIIAETGVSYGRLQEAVDAIGAGSGTIDIAAGRYRDCAVQTAGAVRYNAMTPGAAAFSGGTCEGKAALVLRGRAARVEGLIFERMMVPDGNGAGIRLEAGDLTVENATFRDSQQGILTAAIPDSAITITQSTFSRLGRCDGDLACAHSAYIGEVASLTVIRSRFEAGTGGHYLKARARQVKIVGNSFDDSHGRVTNYMIDLPNGATGVVSDNEMVQGTDKDNYSAFIAVGAEGASQPSDGLSIRDNSARFVPGITRQSAFVADWTGARIAMGTNSLGRGITAMSRR